MRTIVEVQNGEVLIVCKEMHTNVGTVDGAFTQYYSLPKEVMEEIVKLYDLSKDWEEEK